MCPSFFILDLVLLNTLSGKDCVQARREREKRVKGKTPHIKYFNYVPGFLNQVFVCFSDINGLCNQVFYYHKREAEFF